MRKQRITDEAILAAMAVTGNQQIAAKRLGIHRATLSRRLKRIKKSDSANFGTCPADRPVFSETTIEDLRRCAQAEMSAEEVCRRILDLMQPMVVAQSAERSGVAADRWDAEAQAAIEEAFLGDDEPTL